MQFGLNALKAFAIFEKRKEVRVNERNVMIATKRYQVPSRGRLTPCENLMNTNGTTTNTLWSRES